MKLGDMQLAEVVTLLCCSPSSAKNYINELLDGGIVYLVSKHRGKCGRATFRLCLSMPQTAGCRDFNYANDTLSGRSQRRLGAFGLRHFHILSDDEQFVVTANNAQARRDPMVTAFFGNDYKQLAIA